MMRTAAAFAVMTVALTPVLTGCSQHQDGSPPAAVTSVPSSQMDAGDALACDAVETTIARLTSATVGWSPTLHPFDATINGKILGFANDLQSEADQATSEAIQTQIKASALAFADLSTAMSNHDATKVTAAIGTTKAEFAKLKEACAFSG